MSGFGGIAITSHGSAADQIKEAFFFFFFKLNYILNANGLTNA